VGGIRHRRGDHDRPIGGVRNANERFAVGEPVVLDSRERFLEFARKRRRDLL